MTATLSQARDARFAAQLGPGNNQLRKETSKANPWFGLVCVHVVIAIFRITYWLQS
jgi:hypothetical protein